MNNWFKCKLHGGYFPPTTPEEHETKTCKEYLKEAEQIARKSDAN